MSKHTPGPWEVNMNAIEGGNMHLASVIDERDIPIDQDEVAANARLIAAAPDLLEALRLALEASLQGRDDKSWEDAAIAAITKAEGK